MSTLDGLTRDDVVLLVAGSDWDGNAQLRALRPGHSLCLVGKFGEGFDIRGPHVLMCRECAEPLWFERGDQVIVGYQRHLGKHGISAPLLP